jgi:glucose-6-phosphate 1-dehydrogenase
MDKINKTDPTIIIIFGATGDLTWRKLIPAIYNLYLDNMMPVNFSVLGIGRRDLTKDQFHHHLLEGINKNSRRGVAKSKDWDEFSKNISYYQGGFTDSSTFSFIEKQIKILKNKWKSHVNRIFYMAVPPMFFEDIVTKLSEAGIAGDEKLSRIVVEKPFGHDLESAKHLNNLLHNLFNENQIYRIDHYLGKETVQNILAFRFANAMFEPIWNRNYIEQIQITVSEQLGVETRGNYYETAGALRDMIQNHLLQLLCLIAMEPPVSFNADEVRNRKVDVLNALRKFKSEEVHLCSVRGQRCRDTDRKPM